MFRKPYEKWIRKREKTSQTSLNNGPSNLPEDNMNSVAELMMNVLTLGLCLGSPWKSKWVNEDSFWRFILTASFSVIVTGKLFGTRIVYVWKPILQLKDWLFSLSS